MQFSRGGGAVHPAAIGVTGYRRARKEGRKERGGRKTGRKGEREREREAGVRARAKEDREREGKRRWSAYTETHVRTRGAARSVVCQVRPVT